MHLSERGSMLTIFPCTITHMIFTVGHTVTDAYWCTLFEGQTRRKLCMVECALEIIPCFEKLQARPSSSSAYRLLPSNSSACPNNHYSHSCHATPFPPLPSSPVPLGICGGTLWMCGGTDNQDTPSPPSITLSRTLTDWTLRIFLKIPPGTF